MSSDETAFLSGAELLSAYRKRQLSPVEVTRAALERNAGGPSLANSHSSAACPSLSRI